ncbi:MAG: rhodanese-like domain-containing protein [Thermoguttaceae bacterium]
MMTTIAKIDARETCDLLNSDPRTLLVCGYEGDEEFHQHHLEGAISLHDFLSRKDSLRKDQPIIFYCACPHDETAIGQARKYQKEGFTNVKVLEGGSSAWQEAGCPVMTTA